MALVTCTRNVEFDAAHRVIGHSGMCKMLHGHRYKMEVTFSASELCRIGMVIDFSVIKMILNKWLLENWDHNTILSIKDIELGNYIEKVTGQKVYYIDNNPTAECMSLYLMHHIFPKLFADHNVVCKKIKLYETPNCYVEVF